MDVRVDHLSVSFRQGVEVLRDASFAVSSGEFVALVGASGCGKSTALNAIAALITPEEADVRGTILIGGSPVGKVKPGSLGYVFQRDALFPWRTVLENVETGMEIIGLPRVERIERAKRLIKIVGLTDFEDYYPYQISGGMRQRTALIRTLAHDPQVILMDEPFAALDSQTRMRLQAELIQIWAANRKTVIFVTHDLSEAITLGERVVLFSKRPGRVARILDVPFPHPRDPFELYGSKQFAEFQATLWHSLADDYRAEKDPAEAH